MYPLSPFSRMQWICLLVSAACVTVTPLHSQAQDATITESFHAFPTYPFSDPDPVAYMGNIYPYFRFQGYSMTPVSRQWKVVTLENRWIRVIVAPEIGGKVLGAIEKGTGKAFIYYNKTVKFREIAMRGPWTSGGIEFNFGDIGHTPTTATPVDYLTRTNADGSVSCIVGSLDLPSRTEWRVEIRLPRDKALFEARSFWYNPTPFTTSFYHWTNAAANADSTLQVIYPGTASIGHGGEVTEWPVDHQGRDLTWYRNNAFGSYKSYHVLGSYTDYFGARWNDFGVIHWSRYTDKPGKKLWIWGLSREGEIWKDLLTDTTLGNTQYVELQSGIHFNQALTQSSRTPFKHMAFLPHASIQFTEAWFPFVGLDNVSGATRDGTLEVQRSGGRIRFAFCPVAPFQGTIAITAAGATVYDRAIALQPMGIYRDSIAESNRGEAFEIRIGNVLHYRSDDDQRRALERPLRETESFDWRSAYGLTLDAQERLRQRDAEGALACYRAALEKEPTYLPALSGATQLYLRKQEPDSALGYAKRGLAVDAYDPEVNYFYGLVQRYRGKSFDAKDGFGIAAHSPTFQTAALMQLAEMAFCDSQWADATDLALRTAQTDAAHIPSLQLLAVLARRSGDTTAAAGYLERIRTLDPLSHFADFERFMSAPTEHHRTVFTGNMRNELPQESSLELASLYYRLGLIDDARILLSLAPSHPMVDLWLAYLAARTGKEAESQDRLNRALTASPALVFPFRQEDMDVLTWARGRTEHWKIKYYLGLLSWSLGRKPLAQQYFDACGELPDFAAFYLTRASFRSAQPVRAAADYQRAVAVGPDEWRTYYALASFYNSQGKYPEGLGVCTEGVKRFPHSYVLKFLQARSLAFNHLYRQSLAILDTLSILPSEGARFGREAYRQACVMTALDTLHRGNMEAALALLAHARLWPERLGAGKPYDVDSRLEDYAESWILRRQGNIRAADSLLNVVHRYSNSHAESNSPQHLIGALALRDAGRKQEAEALLRRWNKHYPANPFARWAVALFRGDGGRAKKIQREMQPGLLNRFTGDQEAVLVADVAAWLRR